MLMLNYGGDHATEITMSRSAMPNVVYSMVALPHTIAGLPSFPGAFHDLAHC
jgi:hypothetical protein